VRHVPERENTVLADTSKRRKIEDNWNVGKF